MTITPSGRHGVAALISLIITALLAGIALAAPAQATAYRYWSYWQGATGSWVAAQTGAGDHVLVDEDVQGWRFGITSEAPAQLPDNAPQFSALCPELAQLGAVPDEVRVAVVIDSGFTADAPEGQTPPEDVISCTTLPEGSTGNQALAAATSVDDQGGLVCAINGYPTDECAAEVSDDVAAAALAASADEEPNPAQAGSQAADGTGAQDSESSGLIIGAAVVGIVVAVALALSRRRSKDEQ